MNTLWLSSMSLLCLMTGCASSAVKDREVEPPAPVRSFLNSGAAREFHIPAADAPTALSAFARQADTQVLFDYRALRERQTPPVDGILTPSDALAALLSGTGLVAEVINERTLAITPDRSRHSMQ
jgi:hypothetical protein